MTVSEWLITCSVSIVILFSIFFLIFLYLFLNNKKTYSLLKKKRPKNLKSKKKKRRQLSTLTQNNRRFFSLMIISIVIVSLSSGIAGFIKYYEMSNLSKDDMTNLADGYYLISQVEDELNKIKENKIDSPEKTNKNIQVLSAKLSGFSAKKGSDRNSSKGQLLLNKYYSLLGQFGLNLSSQSYSKLHDSNNVLDGFSDDIDVIKTQQKKTIEYFKINESSLTNS